MAKSVDLSWLTELDRGERNEELVALARANKMNVFDARRQVHELVKKYDKGRPKNDAT